MPHQKNYIIGDTGMLTGHRHMEKSGTESGTEPRGYKSCFMAKCALRTGGGERGFSVKTF